MFCQKRDFLMRVLHLSLFYPRVTYSFADEPILGLPRGRPDGLETGKYLGLL